MAGRKDLRSVRVIERRLFNTGESARHDSELLARAVWEEFMAPIAEQKGAALERG
jgi:hypothetical protein